MNRRHFLTVTALALGAARGLPVLAADGKKAVTDKDILKDGMPASVPNYCAQPTKQPNKLCPNAKGSCETCQFYNKDNSETTFKGKKVARCQLLGDPTKPQFVYATATCATFVPKS